MGFQVPDPMVELLRGVHFRGKARLLNSLVSRQGVKLARIYGSNFELEMADLIQRKIFLGTLEPLETRVVTRYLKPGMTFVDVGANVGYYTALAANAVGGTGRVYSFEPSPYAFERLNTMVRRNRLGHVTAMNAGLSNSAGVLKLYLGIGSDNHTPTMVPHENSSASDVKVVTLDDEAARQGIDRIDLLKIDIEGYETRALAGASRLLREKRVRAILCEFNEYWLSLAGSSCSDLEKLIRDAGFTEKFPRPGFENRFYQLAS